MDGIEISIPSGRVTLAGTLVRVGVEPGPAALLISGSGPIDRDSNAKRLRTRIMAEVSEHLAANGVASLRYDKRGVGASEGEYLAAGFHDNVDDARAALATLRSRPSVDPSRVVVIGHSEGALIAAELASDSRLAGAILLSGAARDGREVLRWQARQVARTLPRLVRVLMRQDLETVQAKRLERLAASTDDVIRMQLVRVNAKWFREFMGFEPGRALARAAVPVLAITGAKDLQVPPTDIGEMESLVPTPFTGLVVDDVTHLLRREAGPPSLRTYRAQARRPVDADVLALITDWVGAPTEATNGGLDEQV